MGQIMWYESCQEPLKNHGVNSFEQIMGLFFWGLGHVSGFAPIIFQFFPKRKMFFHGPNVPCRKTYMKTNKFQRFMYIQVYSTKHLVWDKKVGKPACPLRIQSRIDGPPVYMAEKTWVTEVISPL